MTVGPGFSLVARFLMLLAFAASFSFSVGAQELTHQYLHTLCGSDCEVDHDHKADNEDEGQLVQDVLTCDFYLFLIGASRELSIEPMNLTVDFFTIDSKVKVCDSERAPNAQFLTSVSARGPPSLIRAL